ncbi:MAG: 50S ribosomal protein L31 [Myxococcota bacterium]|nr:50S ribosomal protein L31 [Myxococcota bacterium]
MKDGIHPNYPEATIECACGAVWKTRSTAGSHKIAICSNCHPFFTGKSKVMDTTGRIERFKNRYAKKAN